MFRKNLITLLLDHPLSVNEIARSVREHPADILSDLEHLLRSLKHTEYEAFVTPAVCKKCGLQFSSEKLNKPSRCPECKNSWVTEPRIEIRARDRAP